ncbi:MAG: LPS assembly protein LptD [Steroidobacteraceae bacterium]
MPSRIRLRPAHFTAPLFAALVGASIAVAQTPPALVPATELTPHCPGEAIAVSRARTQRPAAPKSTGPGARIEPIDVTSDHAIFGVDGKADVSGRVEVRQGDRSISADRVAIDSKRNSLEVEGNVTYKDPTLTVSGEAGNYSGGAAEFRGAQFEMPERPARGTAGALQLDRQGVIKLQDVMYTTCPPDSSDWQIKARSVTLNPSSQTGTSRGAQINFKGVPIIYLPYLSFPIGAARKSGFLFPSIGNSSSGGVQLTMPFYWNIAPQYDLTFEPTLYSRRGVDLGGELRYLSSINTSTLHSNFLPDDHVRGDTRSHVQLLSVTELPGDWRLRLDGANVSDVNYFEDFSQGAEGTSISFLRRLAHLSYRDEHWQAGALLRNYQTIDQQLAPLDRPYTEMPRLYGGGRWNTRFGALPLELGFDSEVVNFQRNAGVTGWRVDSEPRAQVRIDQPGYFVRTALSVRSTQYSLDDTAVGQDESPSRTLPIASIDTGLLFERPAGSHGKRRVTLEPRLLYLYVPYKNQDALPVFDTGLPDLNLVELFRTNRYVGADRLGDANQVSVGITSRLFASDSGTRYLSATLGQRLYFESPRVLLPDEIPQGRNSSDLVAQLELRAYKNWSVDFGLQWDPQQAEAGKSEVRVQYKADGTRVVNLGYRFQRDRLEQVEASGALPISTQGAKQWNAYGRVVYSLRDGKSIEQFAGFEYSSCCWGVRAVARHYVSDRTGERDTGVYLQLELKGLSNVGTAADAFLERGIRGYSSNPGNNTTSH